MEILTFLPALVAALLALTFPTHGDSGAYLGDVYYLENKTSDYAWAEQECQRHGFDGLAVVSSPEEFNHLLRMTETLR